MLLSISHTQLFTCTLCVLRKNDLFLLNVREMWWIRLLLSQRSFLKLAWKPKHFYSNGAGPHKVSQYTVLLSQVDKLQNSLSLCRHLTRFWLPTGEK